MPTATYKPSYPVEKPRRPGGRRGAPARSRSADPHARPSESAPRRRTWRPAASRGAPAAALGVAATLIAVWLVVEPRTADFAAQVYRSRLAHEGFALWDNAWFGGHLLPGYSLVFPPLAALTGPRTVGVVAVLCSAALFAHLVRRYGGAHTRAAAVWFAAAAAGDLFIGRLTFALGVALGLAAVTALAHGHRTLAAILATACAAASPVAGLFLALVAAAAWLVIGRRGVLVLGGPALATAALMALLFPDGGKQPFDLAPALAGITLVLLVRAIADRRLAVLRRGALLYAAAIALAFLVPSPMGSNVARLGTLLAGPLLLYGTREWRRAPVLALCAALTIWQLWGPMSEVAKTMGNPSTHAAYYAPLVRFLGSSGASSGRVEVVPTATRWESVFVAERFALARGWESQLDERYNPLFYNGRLTAASYRQWLLHTGVRFVALPDAPLERWGIEEAALLERSPSYLRLVWHNAHWRVFALTQPPSLVHGPARLLDLGPGGFSLEATGTGQIVVRIHYTRFWHSNAAVCLGRSAGGWTTVEAAGRGLVAVHASWSFGAALGATPQCDPGAGAKIVGSPLFGGAPDAFAPWGAHRSGT